MSGDPYRSSADNLGFRRGERWDSERFAMERDRNRFGERERFEERDTRTTRRGSFGGRQRDRSVDEVYERERRGPRGGYEDDFYEKRTRYDDEPRFQRERAPGRARDETVVLEKERETRFRSPSPPPRRAPARPSFLRRQSSLDTYDRKPLVRYNRDEYDPPARYREEIRPPPLTPIPLPKSRGLPPPRRYAEEEYYDEIEMTDPDFYGDDDFRRVPERVREREIIRRRRPSRSRESRHGHSVRGSVRSSSRDSFSSDGTYETIKSEFPKRGKTRMPGRLVSKKAIIDLGYPFEEDGEVIVILKALGRENIDEVIKLSEDYKKQKVEFTSAKSEAETVLEEYRKEVIPSKNVEVIEDTKVVKRRSPSPARSHQHQHHHSGGGAIVIDAGPREESGFFENRRESKREVVDVERSGTIPVVGPLGLALPYERPRAVWDEREVRAEIRDVAPPRDVLEVVKREPSRSRSRHRHHGHHHDHHHGHYSRRSETDLVIYDRETLERPGEEITLVKREKFAEPDGGVRIEKNKKVPPPKAIRAMLKTLT